jgi:hypothetical protein
MCDRVILGRYKVYVRTSFVTVTVVVSLLQISCKTAGKIFAVLIDAQRKVVCY